ncbi:unnamed protein product, partial [Prorocentrum cordatum]
AGIPDGARWVLERMWCQGRFWASDIDLRPTCSAVLVAIERITSCDLRWSTFLEVNVAALFKAIGREPERTAACPSCGGAHRPSARRYVAECAALPGFRRELNDACHIPPGWRARHPRVTLKTGWSIFPARAPAVRRAELQVAVCLIGLVAMAKLAEGGFNQCIFGDCIDSCAGGPATNRPAADANECESSFTFDALEFSCVDLLLFMTSVATEFPEAEKCQVQGQPLAITTVVAEPQRARMGACTSPRASRAEARPPTANSKPKRQKPQRKDIPIVAKLRSLMAAAGGSVAVAQPRVGSNSGSGFDAVLFEGQRAPLSAKAAVADFSGPAPQHGALCASVRGDRPVAATCAARAFSMGNQWYGVFLRVDDRSAVFDSLPQMETDAQAACDFDPGGGAIETAGKRRCWERGEKKQIEHIGIFVVPDDPRAKIMLAAGKGEFRTRAVAGLGLSRGSDARAAAAQVMGQAFMRDAYAGAGAGQIDFEASLAKMQSTFRGALKPDDKIHREVLGIILRDVDDGSSVGRPPLRAQWADLGDAESDGDACDADFERRRARDWAGVVTGSHLAAATAASQAGRSRTCHSVMNARATLRLYERAECCLGEMIRADIRFDVVGIAAVAHACAKVGDFAGAWRWFDYVLRYELVANLLCCSAMLRARAQKGAAVARSRFGRRDLVESHPRRRRAAGRRRPADRAARAGRRPDRVTSRALARAFPPTFQGGNPGASAEILACSAIVEARGRAEGPNALRRRAPGAARRFIRARCRRQGALALVGATGSGGLPDAGRAAGPTPPRRSRSGRFARGAASRAAVVGDARKTVLPELRASSTWASAFA